MNDLVCLFQYRQQVQLTLLKDQLPVQSIKKEVKLTNCHDGSLLHSPSITEYKNQIKPLIRVNR